MGKIDTSTILLVAGGAALVYFMTRPKPVPPPTYIQVPVPSGGGSGISQQQYITLGTALANAASNIFG